MPTWERIVIAALIAIVLLLIVWKAIVMYAGCADSMLLITKFKRNFYRNKVVWVTGASSGSELRASTLACHSV